MSGTNLTTHNIKLEGYIPLIEWDEPRVETAIQNIQAGRIYPIKAYKEKGRFLLNDGRARLEGARRLGVAYPVTLLNYQFINFGPLRVLLEKTAESILWKFLPL